MSKKESIWLIIRGIGLYFGYCALFALLSLAGSVPDLFSLPKIDRPERNSSVPFDPSRPEPSIGQPIPTPEPALKEKDAAEQARLAEALSFFLLNLATSGLYLIGAWYFLRDGRFVFDALMREEPTGIGETAVVTGLNLADPSAGKTSPEEQTR